MKATITVDAREWRAAAKKLFETSSRSCVDFTNGQALRVASLAIRHTEKASRQQIEALMSRNVSTETLRGGRSGKRGWVRVHRTADASKWRNTVAARMVLAYKKKHGEWPVNPTTGTDLGDFARRLVAVKVKSVGMMKAGWITAVNMLRRIVYKLPPGTANLSKFGRSNKLGYAVPARFSLRSLIVSTIVNEAPAYQQSHRKEKAWTGTLGDPSRVLVTGLQTALNLAAADMTKTLAKRLNPDFKAVSKR